LIVFDKNSPSQTSKKVDFVLSDISVDNIKLPNVGIGKDIKVKSSTRVIDLVVFDKNSDLFSHKEFLFRINGNDAIRQTSPYYSLRNLYYGKYQVDVASISEWGEQSDWTKVLLITIPAPWYKSKMFLLSLFAAICGIIIFFVSHNYSKKNSTLKEEIDTMRRHSADNQFIIKLHYFIQMNINNPNLDVNMICKELGLSHTVLFNKVKQITGNNIKDYIDGVRVERAIELIKTTDNNFVEIAELTGFVSSRYFSTFFKRKTGMTPSEYRLHYRVEE